MSAMNTPLGDTPAIHENSHNILNENNFSGEQSAHRSDEFNRLRDQIAVLDGGHLRARVSLGVAGLDSALAGGLAMGRVHMMRAASATGYGAVTGFAICVVRHLLAALAAPGHAASKIAARQGQPIVWCPATPLGQTGMLYGTGLAALGLDPGQLLIVDAPNPARRMAVLEDILRTEGLAAVVAEYDGSQHASDYWMRLARRVQLAAEASGTTGLLLGAPAIASGFETSWTIGMQATSPDLSRHYGSRHMPQHITARSWWPRWDVTLHHARGGRPRQCMLEWNPRQNRLYESARDQVMDTPQLDLRVAGRVIPKSGSPRARASGPQSLTG